MNTTMHNKSNNNNNNNATSNLNISISTNSSIDQVSASSPSGGGGGGGSTTIADRIEWSRATILDFIEDYRRQRVLWDPNTKGYHIKQTKYEALKSLGHKYGAEIRSIRSKIKSLRSSFHREHGKVLNSRRKGHNYQPMWFAYDAIRFILDGEAGDSDEADTKSDLNINRETTLIESTNNNNNINHHHLNIDEELMEERKISSRDIEHFNNHFLALGLQARNPMAVIAAVEAAAAATAAQERRQEQENILRQQQQQKLDAATQLKLFELTTTIAANSNNNNKTNTNGCTLTSSSSANQYNPISKSINSPKPTSPLPLALSVSTPATTTTSTSSVTITATPPPVPSSTNTCSPESLNVLHGSRSLDENSALAAATAIPSLSITAVARNSDFDSSEYCNISADDVKTEIFESDSNELAMLESTRTSTPLALNYQKNATDLSTNRTNTMNSSSANNANTSRSNSVGINSGNSCRKRKAQMHSNVNVHYNNEDAPSPSKLQQKQIHQQKQLQHSNAIHSRQCDYLISNNHNLNINQNHNDNNISTINIDNVEDSENDDDDDNEVNYSTTSFSHLQTTLINAGNGNNNNNSTNTLNSQNFKINNNNNSNSTPIDEYGVFGEYVAITIRKLKTSKAKIVVKHLINNLLYEAEMGKYDQGISSCKEPPELYKM